MQRVDLTPVYVLHTRPFRNTSLIVDLFSEQYGRVTVVAKSARGPKSRYQGKLQPFTFMLASWLGSRELKSLGHIELNDAPLFLDDQALFCGFYLNELLIKLLEKEDPLPQLFSVYHKTLLALSENDKVEVALRLFEKRLLEILGYGIPFKEEARTGQLIQPSCYYRFVLEQGFCLIDHANVREDDPLVFQGAHLISIAQGAFADAASLLSAKRLFRAVLTSMLSHRSLNSRALFLSV